MRDGYSLVCDTTDIDDRQGHSECTMHGCRCTCHQPSLLDVTMHDTSAAELTQWWLERADAEIQATVPKSVEYGAYDLELAGRVLADMIDWDESVTPRTEALHVELGVYFYLLGKVGRLTSAYRDSRLPSDDTWHDASVYSRMAQRARSHGGWPGKEQDGSI